MAMFGAGRFLNFKAEFLILAHLLIQFKFKTGCWMAMFGAGRFLNFKAEFLILAHLCFLIDWNFNSKIFKGTRAV